MISVIVPIYNAENILYRCVDSILAQSYTDFELLLINDGSIDNSGAICDAYAAMDSRVRVFHKENGGVSSARNLGLDNARGEWITFCDSDDYVGEDWLKSFIDGITNDVELVIQGIYYIKNNGKIEIKKLSPYCGCTIIEKRELIESLMEQGVFGYPVTKLFRRCILESYRIRFDIQSSFREDEQFFSKYLLYTNRYKCVEDVNYYYILPTWSKKYIGDENNSLLPTFQSLDLIYENKLPGKICQMYYVLIKDYAVVSIIQGKIISLYHLDLYRRMSEILGYNKQIKQVILFNMIRISRSFPCLSKCILKSLQK